MIKIYYLFRENKINDDVILNEVVYVGRSKNVKTRISRHKKDKNLYSYGIFEEVETIEEAKEKEDYYIVRYNPMYNRCLNKSGIYRKMQEILDENDLDISQYGEFINLLITRGVKPVFKDNYNPLQIQRVISSTKFGGYVE